MCWLPSKRQCLLVIGLLELYVGHPFFLFRCGTLQSSAFLCFIGEFGSQHLYVGRPSFSFRCETLHTFACFALLVLSSNTPPHMQPLLIKENTWPILGIYLLNVVLEILGNRPTRFNQLS